MENKSPAFQWYPADYLSDINVILMSNEQRGCYGTLLSHEWLSNGKGIPRDIEAIAKLCGEDSKKMAMLWKGIEKCFKPHPKDDTKLIHPRLEKERKKQNDNRKKRTKAGKQGANARWQTHGNRNATAMAKNGSSSSTSTSTSTSVVNKSKEPWEIKETSKEVIDYLNKVTGKNFKYTDANIIIISARLAEKYTLDDIKRVVDIKSAEWLGGKKMDKFLRPSTLFRKSNFDNYANESPDLKDTPKVNKKLEIIKNWGEKHGRANLPTRDCGLIDVGTKN
jgi:uncharacterized phage protein (TIGR02220 family)